MQMVMISDHNSHTVLCVLRVSWRSREALRLRSECCERRLVRGEARRGEAHPSSEERRASTSVICALLGVGTASTIGVTASDGLPTPAPAPAPAPRPPPAHELGPGPELLLDMVRLPPGPSAPGGSPSASTTGAGTLALGLSGGCGCDCNCCGGGG